MSLLNKYLAQIAQINFVALKMYIVWKNATNI